MDEQTRQQITEEINAMIRSRREFINSNYVRIREAYKNLYDWPELDILRNEICICLTFGLSQAAITLTNHMLETLLKQALVIKRSSEQQKPTDTESPTVESFVKHVTPALEEFALNDLGDNINRARSLGLISKQQKKELHEIREDFRNAFSHSDKEKTFKGATIGAQAMKIGEKGLETGPPEEAEIAKLIFAHGLLQVKQAEAEAIPYFLYVDKLTRDIFSKLSTKH